MSTFESQMDKIREYFEEHKAERYPFENVILGEKDEYTKSLYLRMLCALIRYTGEPGEMQILYVRRIIAGINTEEEFPAYMKKALDLETTDVGEFIAVFKDDVLRYYFCIDGIILLSVEESNDKHYEFLAELVEILGVTHTELTYLASVAKAIIMQSSEAFDEAKKLRPDSMGDLSLYPYVCGFYSGMIIDTPEKCHIYSQNKDTVDMSNHSEFNAKCVILENISATIGKDILFDGCEEVIIRKCRFNGSEYNMIFERVGKVIVEECEIMDFSNRFACFTDVNNIIVRNSRFLNCGYSNGSRKHTYGGVLYSNDGQTDSVILEKNELLNCYITAGFGLMTRGVFLHLNSKVYDIKVLENRFVGCKCSENDNMSFISAYRSIRSKTEEGNICTGSVARIFD